MTSNENENYLEWANSSIEVGKSVIENMEKWSELVDKYIAKGIEDGWLNSTLKSLKIFEFAPYGSAALGALTAGLQLMGFFMGIKSTEEELLDKMDKVSSQITSLSHQLDQDVYEIKEKIDEAVQIIKLGEHLNTIKTYEDLWEIYIDKLKNHDPNAVDAANELFFNSGDKKVEMQKAAEMIASAVSGDALCKGLLPTIYEYTIGNMGAILITGNFLLRYMNTAIKLHGAFDAHLCQVECDKDDEELIKQNKPLVNRVEKINARKEIALKFFTPKTKDTAKIIQDNVTRCQDECSQNLAKFMNKVKDDPNYDPTNNQNLSNQICNALKKNYGWLDWLVIIHNSRYMGAPAHFSFPEGTYYNHLSETNGTFKDAEIDIRIAMVDVDRTKQFTSDMRDYCYSQLQNLEHFEFHSGVAYSAPSSEEDITRSIDNISSRFISQKGIGYLGGRPSMFLIWHEDSNPALATSCPNERFNWVLYHHKHLDYYWLLVVTESKLFKVTDIWHAIHRDNAYDPSTWTTGGSPGRGSIIPVACATTIRGHPDDYRLHLLGSDVPGSLWHTTRHYDATCHMDVFDAPKDLNELVLPQGSFFKSIACAGIEDILHILASDNDGNLWHTIRDTFGNSNGFGWGSVRGACGDIGCDYVACTGVNGDLHVLAETNDGKLWHTIRHTKDGSWDNFKEVETLPGLLNCFACTGVKDDLHVVAVTCDSNLLWHTIRHTNDHWDTWNPAKHLVWGQGDMPLSIDGGPAVAIACAARMKGNVDVVVTKGDFSGILYTVREQSGYWWDWLSLQERGPVHSAACACDGLETPFHHDDRFHICAKKP
jgi:hypothetical protein